MIKPKPTEKEMIQAAVAAGIAAGTISVRRAPTSTAIEMASRGANKLPVKKPHYYIPPFIDSITPLR